MSFDVYVIPSDNISRELATLADLLNAFGTAVVPEDGRSFGLIYDDIIYSHVFYTLDELHEYVEFVAINRPTENEQFWKALYELISRFHYYIVWPGSCGPCYAREGTSIPAALQDSQGKPVMIRSAIEIPVLIRSS